MTGIDDTKVDHPVSIRNYVSPSPSLRPPGAGRLVSSALLVVVVAAACGSSPRHSAAPTPTPTPTKSKALDMINPLTGVGSVPPGPVVAVKVDDTANGRPQVGIDKADVVYVETAEGGVSRLIGIFATNRPAVEPVRSVRASDVELLQQYGSIVLIASGGGGDALPTVDKSKLHAVIADRGAAGFSRDAARHAPYNLRADLAAVTAKLTAQSARDVGFSWSAATPTPTALGTSIKTRVGSTDVAFTWNAAARRYDRVIDGAVQKAADGSTIATPNVIVQFCKVTEDGSDVDVTGKPAQYTHTVGSGQVAVFRDGKRITGTWSRPTDASPTKFSDASGKPIALAPGGVWILLVAAGTSLPS